MEQTTAREIITRALLAEANLRASYESAIRNLAYSYWAGRIGRVEFYSFMTAAIQSWLVRAWELGMRDAGLKLEDMTDVERATLQSFIFQEQTFIDGLAQFIESRLKQIGGGWFGISARVKLWGNRFTDIRNKAKLMAEEDPKLKWELGPSKDHCKTCAKLAGKVKRASFWRDKGISPQSDPDGRLPNSKLDCQGWGCQCSLNKTEDALSRGPLPNVP